MAAAARNITPVHLELGGKSPVVVFADADLEQAAGWAMMAAFVNMGEVCVAGSRLLVHESVYDEVVARVAEQASFLHIGDAPDPDRSEERRVGKECGRQCKYRGAPGH